MEFRVRWYGPPGSSAFLNCLGQVHAMCTVPGGEGDPWGTCEETSLLPVAIYDSHDSICAYVMPGGGRAPEGARGRCEAVVPVPGGSYG